MQEKARSWRETGRYWGTVPFGCQRNQAGKLEPLRGGAWFNPVLQEWSTEEREGWDVARLP